MMFSVKNGHFGYKNREILRDLSFSVESGNVLAVLGPNGVGKTTLLRCMMGLLHWKQGASYIDERPITEFKSAELWRKIAYVPQSKGTSLSYSAADMVLMGRSARIGLFKQPTDEDRYVATQAMQQVGITHLSEKKCSEMSGGELQMVLIARALAGEPALLVMDEPESNLDFKNQLIILEAIRELAKKQNIAVIVNTHYPAHALKVADHALILYRSGASVWGTAAETITEESMCHAFEVQVKIQAYEHESGSYASVIPLRVLG